MRSEKCGKNINQSRIKLRAQKLLAKGHEKGMFFNLNKKNVVLLYKSFYFFLVFEKKEKKEKIMLKTLLSPFTSSNNNKPVVPTNAATNGYPQLTPTKGSFARVFDENVKSQIYESYTTGYIHPEFRPFFTTPFKNTPLGLNFRPMHPDWGCPAGFEKNKETGLCMMPPSNGEATQFSPDARAYQTRLPLKPQARFFDNFAMRSSNPFTGKTEVYFGSKRASSSNKYVVTPAKDGLVV